MTKSTENTITIEIPDKIGDEIIIDIDKNRKLVCRVVDSNSVIFSSPAPSTFPHMMGKKTTFKARGNKNLQIKKKTKKDKNAEKEDQETDMIATLMANPLEIKDFSPLSREEANER